MLKKTCIAAGTILALTTGNAAFAHDQPGAGWISKDAAILKVKAQGYDAVRLEADDGRWEGEGIKNGQKMEFKADPKTGVIISEKQEK